MKISDLLTNINDYPRLILSSKELYSCGFTDNASGNGLSTIRTRAKNSLSHFRIGSSIRYLKTDVVDYVMRNVKKKHLTLESEYGYRELFDLKHSKSQVRRFSSKNEERKDEATKTIESLWKVVEDLNSKLNYYLDNR